MTANPFAALLAKIGRYSHDCDEPHLVPEPDGKWLDRDEVLAALAAAVPADLAEAGKVLEKTVWVVFNDAPNMGGAPAYVTRHDPRPLPLDRLEAVEFAHADLITALLARLAAQEAQIKGLEKDRDRFEAALGRACLVGGTTYLVERAEAAETALAAMTKERDELRACIAWVDEVYPERIEAGGAGIQITWEEFNAMQATIGVTVDKRIGGPEGKAVHNHRLRSALAAEREKVARLVEAGPPFFFDRYINGVRMAEDVCVERETTLEGAMRVAARIAAKGPNGEPPVLVYRSTETAARAAITEAGQ